MIDNLKLELTQGMTLTPDDTDVVNNTTVDFAWNQFTLGAHTGNFVTAPPSAYTSRDGSNTAGLNMEAWRQADPTAETNCLEGGDTIYNAASLTKCGYYYNFYTATAGSGTATLTSGTAGESICPAGWRLPTGYTGAADIDNDLPFLNARLADAAATTGSISHTTYANWYPSGAFQGAISGGWSDQLQYQGTYGYYWSSTLATVASRAQFMAIGNNSIYPADFSDERVRSFAVRCVSDGGERTAPPPTVTFDGVLATDVVLASDGLSLTAVTPAGSAGWVDVVVADGVGTDAELPDGYLYYDPIVISGVDPNHGVVTGGTTVTISGSGFVATGSTSPTVEFDGVAATVVSATASEIVVTTPAHAAGLVDVAVDNGLTSEIYAAEYDDPAGDLTDPDNVESGYLYDAISVKLSVDGEIYMGGPPNALYTDSVEITVETNNPTGYELTLQSAQPDLECPAASGYPIEALAAAGPMSFNHWGYGTGTTEPTAWTGVTTTPSSPIDSSLDPTPEFGNVTTLWFGTKFNFSLPACRDYTTMTLLTAVASV
jgi:uncharacterized protein (TIGR02145 family)